MAGTRNPNPNPVKRIALKGRNKLYSNKVVQIAMQMAKLKK